jgi:hypothetical protein
VVFEGTAFLWQAVIINRQTNHRVTFFIYNF